MQDQTLYGAQMMQPGLTAGAAFILNGACYDLLPER